MNRNAGSLATNRACTAASEISTHEPTASDFRSPKSGPVRKWSVWIPRGLHHFLTPERHRRFHVWAVRPQAWWGAGAAPRNKLTDCTKGPLGVGLSINCQSSETSGENGCETATSAVGLIKNGGSALFCVT